MHMKSASILTEYQYLLYRGHPREEGYHFLLDPVVRMIPVTLGEAAVMLEV